MNVASTIGLIAAIYTVIFVEVFFAPLRGWIGAQIDLLPALIVYASLNGGLTQVTLVAVAGGLMYDSFSANPLGISVLPLFAIGLALLVKRDLVLRESRVAQFFLGFGASALAPLFALFALAADGQKPWLGWGSLYQWLILSLAGAGATPLVFWAFEKWILAFEHPAFPESSFRSDREIKRGRF